MKIINLKAENVKKIKAIEITPTDNTVIISGKNGQGKTSVLDSILFALGGKKALDKTPKPVRDGQDRASVQIDLGDYQITRTWNSKGTTLLEVYSKEAGKLSSPQALLDKIVGSISFDPLEFGKMKPAEQKQVLLDVLGVAEKIEELQAVYKETYDERTLVGREVKNAEGFLNTITLPQEAPLKPVDVFELSERLSEALKTNSLIDDAQEDLENAQADIVELKKQIAIAEKAIKDSQKTIKTHNRVDTEAIRRELSEASALNEAFEQVSKYQQANKDLEIKKETYLSLSTKLLGVEQEKEKVIISAKLPIKGLNIDTEGVTYKGIPFTQLSSAEQLKVSLAIAMSTNPKLRVIRILDGSLLDSDNLKVIQQMAKDGDYQVWIERVEDGGKVGIVIENGEVKGVK